MDLELPARLYDESDCEKISDKLKLVGLPRLADFIINLQEKLAEHEETIDELESRGCALCNNSTEGREAFADHFINEFEGKKIKVKEINGTTFGIVLISDLEKLKKKFHQLLD